VGDQSAVVPLHAAQDMGPASDNKIGASPNDRVRERDRVAAVLTEEGLRARPHVAAVRAFRPRVPGPDHEGGLRVCAANETNGTGDVSQILIPWVRSEAQDGDANAALTEIGDLAGPAGVPKTLAVEGRERLGLSARSVVERVIVRQVQDGEAGAPQYPCVGG